MAERNPKTGLEVTEVLLRGVSLESPQNTRSYLHAPAFSLAQNPLSSLSHVYTFTPHGFSLARRISHL